MSTGKDELPPIPRPLTRGSVPPDFKVFEQNNYGEMKIKPGPPEILEEHPEKQQQTFSPRAAAAGLTSDAPDDAFTDPDSDYDTELEDAIEPVVRNVESHALETENEHLYQRYLEECARFHVVPISRLIKGGGLENSKIDLSNRTLGPKPIVALAHALTSNAQVQELDISGNAIGWAGSKVLFEMLKDNYTDADNGPKGKLRPRPKDKR